MSNNFKTNNELLAESVLGFVKKVWNSPVGPSDRSKTLQKRDDRYDKLNAKLGADNPYKPEDGKGRTAGYGSILKPGFNQGEVTRVADTDEMNKRLTQFIGQGVATNSIKAQASKAIKKFPIIMSELIDPDNALLIKKKAEEEYAEILALVISNKVIDSTAFKTTETGSHNIALRAIDDTHTEYDLTRDSRTKAVANKATATGSIGLSDIGKYDITYSLISESARFAESFKKEDGTLARILEDAIIVPEGSVRNIINYLNENMLEIFEEADKLYLEKQAQKSEIEIFLESGDINLTENFDEVKSIIDKHALDLKDREDKESFYAAASLFLNGEISYDDYINYLKKKFVLFLSPEDKRKFYKESLRIGVLNPMTKIGSSTISGIRPNIMTKLFRPNKAKRLSNYSSSNSVYRDFDDIDDMVNSISSGHGTSTTIRDKYIEKDAKRIFDPLKSYEKYDAFKKMRFMESCNTIYKEYLRESVEIEVETTEDVDERKLKVAKFSLNLLSDESAKRFLCKLEDKDVSELTRASKIEKIQNLFSKLTDETKADIISISKDNISQDVDSAELLTTICLNTYRSLAYAFISQNENEKPTTIEPTEVIDILFKEAESGKNLYESENNVLKGNFKGTKYISEGQDLLEALFKKEEVDYTKKLTNTPTYQARGSKAYGTAEIDRRFAKDRKFYQPLTITVTFKERLSDGTYTDNELHAVIGVIGEIKRVPTEEMVQVLKLSAENSNDKVLPSLSGIGGIITNTLNKLIGGNEVRNLVKSMPKTGEVFQNLAKMSTLAMSSALGGRGGSFLVNAHIVFSAKEIDDAATEFGFNYLKDSKYPKALMKKFSIYSLMICNDISDRLAVFDDVDNTGWNWIPISSIKSGDGSENLAGNLKELIRNKGGI